MIGQVTKPVERGLLLVCLLAAAVGATNPGVRVPLRISSDDSSRHLSPPSSSPGICSEEPSSPRPLQRSTSRSRWLGSSGDMQDTNLVHGRTTSCSNLVYEPVQQRDRLRWSPEPVTSEPPLLSDRPDGGRTYIKTKLYPHLLF
ncbi:hypothetical protein T484DRAFT_1783589 [Baffinella frigidus]|nr:hypothetical protein T484DRAFT_1783589 [Cryptophyta sp. CCMP2293]|mmetsp:Transcript_26085/g.60196  ORF Transcript_26085/g.60196 Transcript_26085/m.60196 type:complete len:144 (+) Transcript_26085:53-484(+)